MLKQNINLHTYRKKTHQFWKNSILSIYCLTFCGLLKKVEKKKRFIQKRNFGNFNWRASASYTKNTKVISKTVKFPLRSIKPKHNIIKGD